MAGADKIFHRRKARKLASHKREIAKRDPYEMVLIVCEGIKTEPNYFEALIDDLQLNTANVKVSNNTAGSSPRSVVKFALNEYKKDKKYDKVYCVIDKDRHETYLEALDIIRRVPLQKRREIHAITSVPCFEFWFLLHYKATTKKFNVCEGSICAKVITDLKKYIPNYEKRDKEVFLTLKPHLETAITNAKKVSRYCEDAVTDNPSTKVHELIIYLQNLKNGQQQ